MDRSRPVKREAPYEPIPDTAQKAESAAAALMADLGTARREDIVTGEYRHYREASEAQLEGLRESSNPRSFAYQFAKNNKNKFDAWKNMWQEEDNGGNDETEGYIGQTHRLRVHEELHGQSGPPGRQGQRGGKQGGKPAGRATSHGRQPKKADMPSMPLLVGPRGSAAPTKKPTMASKGAVELFKNRSQPAKKSSPEKKANGPWPETNELPRKARGMYGQEKEMAKMLSPQPARVQREPVTRAPAVRAAEEDGGYTGNLMKGDDFMARVEAAKAARKAAAAAKSAESQPRETTKLGTEAVARSNLTIQPHEAPVTTTEPRAARSVSKTPQESLLSIREPHDQKGKVKTQRHETHSVEAKKAEQKPASATSLLLPYDDTDEGDGGLEASPIARAVQASYDDLNARASHAEDLAGLNMASLIESGSQPTAPVADDRSYEDMNIDEAEHRKERLTKGLFGLEALLEISPYGDITQKIADVQNQLKRVQARINTLSKDQDAMLPVPKDQQERVASPAKDVEVEHQALVSVPTAEVVTAKTERVERPTLEEIGIIGDLAASVHRTLQGRFADYKPDPLPPKPRVGPHNLPGRHPSSKARIDEASTEPESDLVIYPRRNPFDGQTDLAAGRSTASVADAFSKLFFDEPPSQPPLKKPLAAPTASIRQPIPQPRSQASSEQPSTREKKQVAPAAPEARSQGQSSRPQSNEPAQSAQGLSESKHAKQGNTHPDADKILVIRWHTLRQVLDAFQSLRLARVQRLDETTFLVQFTTHEEAEKGYFALPLKVETMRHTPTKAWYVDAYDLPKLRFQTQRGGEWLVVGVNRVQDVLVNLHSLEFAITCIRFSAPVTYSIHFQSCQFANLGLNLIPEEWRQPMRIQDGVVHPSVVMVGEHSAPRPGPSIAERIPRAQLETKQAKVKLEDYPLRPGSSFGQEPAVKELGRPAMKREPEHASKTGLQSVLPDQRVPVVESEKPQRSPKQAPVPAPKTQALPTPKPEPESATKCDPQPAMKLDEQLALKPEPTPTPKSEHKPAPKPGFVPPHMRGHQSAPKQEPELGTKSQTRSAPTPEKRPPLKLEPQPSPTPEWPPLLKLEHQPAPSTEKLPSLAPKQELQQAQELEAKPANEAAAQPHMSPEAFKVLLEEIEQLKQQVHGLSQQSPRLAEVSIAAQPRLVSGNFAAGSRGNPVDLEAEASGPATKEEPENHAKPEQFKAAPDAPASKPSVFVAGPSRWAKPTQPGIGEFYKVTTAPNAPPAQLKPRNAPESPHKDEASNVGHAEQERGWNALFATYHERSHIRSETPEWLRRELQKKPDEDPGAAARRQYGGAS